ncbi:hypothetical protein PHISCL_03931 [Aspergillus sclerotialis]|uniref:Uncharacterized protein n=1 Tax=Aspergillus sclerotialis TaxID=2070753 RepID=A0A3A2ZKL6_9EURO|nr:hypothetical protein PHISCL_03931 [Aspergillus sclerotialis]
MLQKDTPSLRRRTPGVLLVGKVRLSARAWNHVPTASGEGLNVSLQTPTRSRWTKDTFGNYGTKQMANSQFHSSHRLDRSVLQMSFLAPRPKTQGAQDLLVRRNHVHPRRSTKNGAFGLARSYYHPEQ